MQDGSKEGLKDPEGESSTGIPGLDDLKLAQKVEKVIQKSRTGKHKEDECILEGTTPFVSIIVRINIPFKFKLPQLE